MNFYSGFTAFHLILYHRVSKMGADDPTTLATPVKSKDNLSKYENYINRQNKVKTRIPFIFF